MVHCCGWLSDPVGSDFLLLISSCPCLQDGQMLCLCPSGCVGLLGWPWLGRASVWFSPCFLGPGLPLFLLLCAGCGSLCVLCSAPHPARELCAPGKPGWILTWRTLLICPGLKLGFSDPMARLLAFLAPCFFYCRVDLCQGVWGRRELWISSW